MKIHSKTSWFFKGVIYNIAAVLLLIIQGLVETFPRSGAMFALPTAARRNVRQYGKKIKK